MRATQGRVAQAKLLSLIDVTPVNDAPVLAQPTSPISYVDTAANDSFSATSGTLAFTDPDAGDSHVYGLTGTTTSSGLSGYNIAQVGTYGTMYLNSSSSGAYTFVPNDAAIEALDGTQTGSDTFTFKVTDGAGASDSTTLQVDVTGADEGAGIAGLASFSLTGFPLSVADVGMVGVGLQGTDAMTQPLGTVLHDGSALLVVDTSLFDLGGGTTWGTAVTTAPLWVADAGFPALALSDAHMAAVAATHPQMDSTLPIL